MEQSDLVELLTVFSGNGMQNFGFLSMLRFASVFDAVMLLWLPENVSVSGEFIFSRLLEIFEHDSNKLLFNCFWGVNLTFEILLLIEGVGLIIAKSIDCLAVEL